MIFQKTSALCLLTAWLLLPGSAAVHAGEQKQASTEGVGEEIAELYVTRSQRRDNLDSIGIYAPDKDRVWAITTAKQGHALIVFDAQTGQKYGRIGSQGTAPGKFKRPNGVLVVDDWCLVVERDNHRVQILRLPDFKPLSLVGTDVLKRPYGLTAYKDEAGHVQLFVTDDYEHEGRGEPDAAFYTERVKHFELREQNGQIVSKLVGAFGDASGPGRLFKVESILVDAPHQRLYIADEQGPSKGIKIYDLNGKFTGKRMETDRFLGEPEGLAIYAEGDGGYLVTTDQRPNISVFHLFDRNTLEHVAAFHGPKTANTDGIAVSAKVMSQLGKGGLWAIHDDQALAAFDWQKITAVLK